MTDALDGEAIIDSSTFKEGWPPVYHQAIARVAATYNPRATARREFTLDPTGGAATIENVVAQGRKGPLTDPVRRRFLGSKGVLVVGAT